MSNGAGYQSDTERARVLIEQQLARLHTLTQDNDRVLAATAPGAELSNAALHWYARRLAGTFTAQRAELQAAWEALTTEVQARRAKCGPQNEGP